MDSCLGMAGWQASDATKGALVELYNSFISTFWEKLNRKRLASFMIKAANCVSAGPEARLSFLQEGSSKLLTERTPDAEAGLVLRCEMAGIVLETGETKECKKMVEEIEEKLDGMTGCENRTYSTFHKAAALYYKAMNDAEAYYKAALQFLGYVDLADLSAEEQHGWAFDIGKAALLGEKVFNFGELLVHPVLKSLEGSGEAWMTELLLAFNAGDVVAYKAATQAHGASISSQPELVAGKTSLEQKIAILALMTLVFNRAGDERVLAFSDIEEATGVGGDGVEFLVMKAVCIGVIDATIDEVEVRSPPPRLAPPPLRPHARTHARSLAHMYHSEPRLRNAENRCMHARAAGTPLRLRVVRVSDACCVWIRLRRARWQ